MKVIEKLKANKKLVVVIGLVIGIFLLPYLTIPGLILWWFYKKSKFSKKFKTIATTAVCGLFIVLMTLGIIAYAKDEVPHLSVTEPASTASIKAQQIAIKGTYDPTDRKVWVNGKEIAASNGSFETQYQLKEGENKIEVTAGNWKRARVNLIVTRELTDEELAARVTPTPSIMQETTPSDSTTSGNQQSVNRNLEDARVIKVVDGDTVTVSIGGKSETIRIIGINTPETVDPRKSVECFGQKASDKAREQLNGKAVQLEADATQGERDKYSRLLRFVWLDNGTVDFGAMMIQEGYAYEYTYSTPYSYQAKYKELQKEAEQGKRGLWADNACPVQTNTSTNVTSSTAPSNNPTTSSSGQTTTTYSGSGDKDCKDFMTHSEAQAYFNSKGGSPTNNVDNLDADHDGIACESLPS